MSASEYRNPKKRVRAGKKAYHPGNRGAKMLAAAAAQRALALQMPKKGVDTIVNSGPVPIVPAGNQTFFLLNAIQTGAGSFNRVGRTTHLKSLRLKGVISCLWGAAQAVWAGNVIRICVVWDAQANGTTIPTFTEIFGTTDGAGNESTQLMDPPTYDGMARFKLLLDRTIEVMPTSSITGANTQAEYHAFDYYIKLNNLLSNYASSNDPVTTADISTGALYLCYRAQVSDAQTSVITVQNATARLRYTD